MSKTQNTTNEITQDDAIVAAMAAQDAFTKVQTWARTFEDAETATLSPDRVTYYAVKPKGNASMLYNMGVTAKDGKVKVQPIYPFTEEQRESFGLAVGTSKSAAKLRAARASVAGWTLADADRAEVVLAVKGNGKGVQDAQAWIREFRKLVG